MKRLLYFLFCVITFSSCSQNDLSSDAKEDKIITVDYEKVVPYVDYYVHVGKDSIAYVMFNEDTLAVTDVDSTLVRVPNNENVSDISSLINVIYESKTINNQVLVGACTENRQTIMFEDTRNGDNDYNDFIFQVIQRKNIVDDGSGDRHGIVSTNIQPVALGSSAKTVIKLGVDISYVIGGKKQIISRVLSENVRTDTAMFAGLKTTDGFINTTKYDKRYPAREMMILTPDATVEQFLRMGFRFNWWIEANGEKLYSIPEDKLSCGSWYNESGYPYGLVFTDIYGDTKYFSSDENVVKPTGENWIAYPKEYVNIEKAYPGFSKWLENSNTKIDWAHPSDGTYFDALGEFSYVSGTKYEYHPQSIYFFEEENKK